MKKTVVSFADGVGNYMKAMNRLELSLQGNFDGTFKGVNDYGHIASVQHKEVPYQFKAKSIYKAMEDGGELILWCDSVVYAKQSIEPVFDHIKEYGYLFFDNIGFTVGDYTSDACLAHFGVTREEAFKMPMIMACVMGLNIHNSTTQEFIRQYVAASEDGLTYPGAWSNKNAEVSYDLRVQGHRHDQSVASILIHKLGMEILKGNETFFMYQEHLKVMHKADSVCLFSQGI
jgi:hypothetical protein